MLNGEKYRSAEDRRNGKETKRVIEAKGKMGGG